MNELAGIDLNLVVALNALLEERSVTRAARRVGLSQPAMSHALGRLREHFDDPLLIRAGRAMSPTSLGLQLLAPVQAAVRHLQRLMVRDSSDPSSRISEARLVADDCVGTLLLPDFLGRMQKVAPHLSIDILPRGQPGRKALLRLGKAELAVGAFSGAGLDLHRQHLFDEDWAMVIGVGSGEVLTVESWAARTHVIVSPTGGRRGAVDTALAKRGLERRVVVAVPHFLTALSVVARTNHVLLTSRSLAEKFAPSLGLEVCASPMAMPAFSVSMLWHKRTQADPAQRWLREQLAASIHASRLALGWC